eukprot:CAMPEP_0175109862 /NCGR_PEP_ID=MMETSP0086_2-20121207/13668_1 /TAXON_ID=136419 /ORGANISM="Unknown Unknown, Strain D1" /LENGTH=141 /DNA_ID=CAMNT_0016387711 /DNA_START=659 /DNA_END=1084 /DNA_ORIENTATION=+
MFDQLRGAHQRRHSHHAIVKYAVVPPHRFLEVFGGRKATCVVACTGVSQGMVPELELDGGGVREHKHSEVLRRHLLVNVGTSTIQPVAEGVNMRDRQGGVGQQPSLALVRSSSCPTKYSPMIVPHQMELFVTHSIGQGEHV